MQWFDRWFYKKVRWAWGRAGLEHPNWKQQEDYLDRMAQWGHRGGDAPDVYLGGTESVSGRLSNDPHDLSDGMRIDVKKITGGHVVTVRVPPRADRSGLISESEEVNSRTSYMIGDDEDFDQSLCRILGMERLKR